MSTSTGQAPLQVVVMGVSGTGKSTVAAALRDRLGWGFVEGDDLHPASNVTKMAHGTPLTDEDRWPWLDRVRAAMVDRSGAGEHTVVTCSALRRAYRDRLRQDLPGVFFLLLDAPFDVLEPRVAGRADHFMPSSLLRSQVDTLETLEGDEDGAVVDVTAAPEVVQDEAEGAVRRRLER
ncbi:gluconokinase [Nocardioides bruguierae]|uniref:Gluconokinase n=1 Tax=Nocardioides bruguierae TaxID=2945102 RepID=A0A9X2DAC8_9ACTN|nr:gluconokinase [Nocardioides bruguierae]MCM0622271.1 gluconokinase [Nocardioides bruguierae]